MEKHEERDPRTFAVIGAAMEVHAQLGCGFLEPVYQEALAIELAAPDIPFGREVGIAIRYKGRVLQCGYRADFVCYDEIVVELKALKGLSSLEEAQIIHYLKATGFACGLLLNFGARSLEWRRFVNSRKQSAD